MYFKNITEFMRFINGERSEYFDYKLKQNIINYTFKFEDAVYRIEKKKKYHLRKKNGKFEEYFGEFGTWEGIEPQLIKLEPDVFKYLFRKRKIEKLLKDDRNARKN